MWKWRAALLLIVIVLAAIGIKVFLFSLVASSILVGAMCLLILIFRKKPKG